SSHRASRGRFKCVDWATGRVRWQTDTVGQATVLVADHKLILLNDTGTLILARAISPAYEELARVQELDQGPCWTPPALWHGCLFIRDPSRAVCVYLGEPTHLATTQAFSPPGRTHTRMDWSWLLGQEPEYPHDAPTIPEIAEWFWWCLVGVFGGAVVAA